jgi:hypothetical protein
MFRVLVLLLILPLLLMPPGVCVCQFFPIGNAAASPAARDRNPSVGCASDPFPDCTCDSCHARAASAAPEGVDDQPARQPEQRPARGHGEHWPGCPAAVGNLPIGAAVPPVKVQADFVVAASFFTPITVTAVSPGRAATVPPRTGSPPLFISFCTLLI